MTLPNFFVIGAMKAGTTNLYHRLRGHPDVSMSRMKETDYFVREMNWPLGRSWYEAQFEPGRTKTGEVSPNYAKRDLFAGVPERIAEAVPDASLIYLVRDPVDRFVSHYIHSWNLGHMKVPPADLLDSENGRHMIACSRYAWQLRPYRALFGRDRLLVLDFADLVARPQETWNRVCAHLGLVPSPLPAGDIVRNDRGSNARMPPIVQRAWRSRTARRLDPLLGRRVRDIARSVLSFGPERPSPDLPDAVRTEAAARLAEDAACLRAEYGLTLDRWSV